MLLFPMRDARHRDVRHEPIVGHFDAERVHPELFRRVRNRHQTHAFPIHKRQFAQIIQRKMLAVMPRDHAQARRSTIHGIQLFIKRKTVEHFLISDFGFLISDFDDTKPKMKNPKYLKGEIPAFIGQIEIFVN
jgi:hypothetical protein